ncbi:MAG: hypothetical protein WC280_02640 [Patescibacteria group bacterium]
MSEKDLLKQLKSLKSIKLDTETKESNKKVLMTQISNTLVKNDNIKTFNSFSFYFKNILSMTSKPAMILGGLFMFLFTSLLLSSGLYKDSKPTDSLYIARVISEKAKLNTTFSQEARERMALEFASKHASDIASVLMDPEFNREENKDTVEKLTASFKVEISKVRNNISQDAGSGLIIEGEEETSVFSASMLKEDNGVEIHIPEKEVEEVDVTILEDSDISSSSIKSLEDQIEELSENDNIDKIEEIERLFEEGKYSEVILILEDIKSNK